MGIEFRELSVVLALSAIAFPPLLAGAYSGVTTIPPWIRDSATAQGMTAWQLVRHVELPLASASIIGGFRIAYIQVISTVVLAPLVGLGGVGFGIIQGLALRKFPQVIASSIVIQSSEAIPIPGFISYLIGAVMAISEREANQVVLIITIFIILGWTGVARFVRGMVLSIREQQYVESARALGASHLYNMLTHVLPNALPPIIISYTLGLSGTLVAESGLSFLGFGIQDPTPSWGNMLAFANSYMFSYPWMPLVPALPILVCSLAINYIGDGLRDALDPRVQTEIRRAQRDAQLAAIRERSKPQS
jgi:ABC-type dipeptide/oligopeptide/nickel transport system permease subunit